MSSDAKDMRVCYATKTNNSYQRADPAQKADP